jgi:hypothetical protein
MMVVGVCVCMAREKKNMIFKKSVSRIFKVSVGGCDGSG